MKIEFKTTEEKNFDRLPLGEVFLYAHYPNAYMKIEEASFYDEDSKEECKANAVHLSTGRMIWFDPQAQVIVPHSHNLLIER